MVGDHRGVDPAGPTTGRVPVERQRDDPEQPYDPARTEVRSRRDHRRLNGDLGRLREV